MSPADTSEWMAESRWRNFRDGSFVTPVLPVEPSGFSVTVQAANNDVRKSGASYTQQDLYTKVTAALGRNLGGRQKYFSAGNIAGAAGNLAAWGQTEPQPVLCFKSFTNAELIARMDAVTAPEAWIYSQEFYGGTTAGGWTSYNDSYATIRGLINAHANGHFIELAGCSSTADERKAPGGFGYAGIANMDSWGADAYNAKLPPLWSPSTFLGPMKTAVTNWRLTKPGIRWRIAEYGISRYQTESTLNTGDERIAIGEAQFQYLRDSGCDGVTFWAVDNSNEGPSNLHDCSIDKGTTADNQFAAWLAAQMTAYPLV